MFHKTGHSRKPWISSWTYLPIYGFGAVLVIFVFARLSNNPLILFFIAVIGTSILEYATGYLSETLFSIRLWDYSSTRFNLKGRVCLLNSTLFGLLSLFVTYGVHPPISQRFLINSLQLSWSMGGQKSSSYCLVLIPPARYCE